MMISLTSLIWSLALLSLAGAGLASVIGWLEGANTLGRWCAIAILLALALDLPWSAMFHASMSDFPLGSSFGGYGWLIFAGHVALVGWLVARRYFPRFTDERARTRARRRFDRDAGGGR